LLKTILTTFIIVFLAELGDKTQLQTMLLATQSKSIWYVFIGSSIALVLSSLIGVFAAGFLTKFINPDHLQTGAGFVFIVIGLLTLFGKI